MELTLKPLEQWICDECSEMNDPRSGAESEKKGIDGIISFMDDNSKSKQVII